MPFAPPVILLDKDDTLHPNIAYFAEVMSVHYRKHNYKQHLSPRETVVEDYYLHNSAVRMFCRAAFPEDAAQAKALEEQLFAQVTALIGLHLAPQAVLNALLFQLKEQGCVFGLITHNTQANTVRDLHEIGLTSLFHPRLVLTEDDLGHARKTTPSGYRPMAERLKEVVPHHGAVFMADDHPSNLVPVAGLGWHPVQIGNAPRQPQHNWPQYATLEDFLQSFSKQLAA